MSHSNRQVIVCCLFIGTLTSLTIAGPDHRESILGQKLESFELQDFRGKSHQLSDYDDHELVVLAFLGTECPLAKLYGPRLQRLAQTYAEGQQVKFLGINPNSQDSITEIAAYARIHDLAFPILKDTGNRLADQIGATRTPEVFVLDRDRQIRYVGRIDDQYGVGYIRDEPQRHDLREAIDQLLSGKQVVHATTETAGCLIGRTREPNQNSEITYSNQIARLLNKRCLECHRSGEIAPFALDKYSEVSGWADMIAEVVRDERMPPWHAHSDQLEFANDRRMSAAEKQLIYDWVDAGAPEGDPADLPEVPQFVEGWQLPWLPDQVVAMSDAPIKVQAEGTVEYKYLRVDPGFEEDKWIKAIEVMPGNRAVVHHILVFATAKGGRARNFGGGVRGFLAGYVPGLRARPYPEGMAKFVPAGSELIFQMHYTPVGTEQEDLSHVGFVFAEPHEITHEVKTTSAFQPGIRIPRRADNHRETTKTRLAQDTLLLALMPHMHVRGKAFEYLIRRPGKDQWTTLLDVPSYDFNWQTNYRFSTPMDLPAGTYIKCVAHFDNSKDNPNNPNPNKTVRWGQQTWEEMLIGYMDVAQRVDPKNRPEDELSATQRAQEFILQLDKNDDFQLQVTELPMRFRLALVASKPDQDQDGVISEDEIIKLYEGFRRRRR